MPFVEKGQDVEARGGKGTELWIIIAAVAACVIVAVLVVCFVLRRRRRQLEEYLHTRSSPMRSRGSPMRELKMRGSSGAASPKGTLSDFSCTSRSAVAKPTPQVQDAAAGHSHSGSARAQHDALVTQLHGERDRTARMQAEKERLERELDVMVSSRSTQSVARGNTRSRSSSDESNTRSRSSSRWSGWTWRRSSGKQGRKLGLIASLRERSAKAAGELSPTTRSGRCRLSSGVASYRAALQSRKQRPADSEDPDGASASPAKSPSFGTGRSFGQLHRAAAQAVHRSAQLGSTANDGSFDSQRFKQIVRSGSVEHVHCHGADDVLSPSGKHLHVERL